MNVMALIVVGATTNYILANEQAVENAAMLSAEPLNVACVNASQTDDPTCASFEVNTKGFARITLLIDYTQASATRFDMAVDGSIDGAAPWYEIQGASGVELPDVPMGPHRPY